MRGRAAYDLAVVSVLLDAGAGPDWRYRDAATAREIGRSEGLALASLDMFAAGDFSPARHAEYDRLLRARFQRLFVFCNRVRAVCLNPPLLNLLVWAANGRPDLKLRLMHIVLGLRP